MKWILVFSFLFLSGCTIQTAAPAPDNSSSRNENIAVNETHKPSVIPSFQAEDEEFGYCKGYKQIKISKTNSPVGKFDFKNMTYPKIWQKGSVRLKNGCVGEDSKNALGGCEFTLESVDFVDFNGDGIDEALVDIGNFCGAGSSSFTHSLFIYEVKNNKLNTIWRLSTGSESYCGVKDYNLDGKEIKLDVYSDCAVKPDGKLDDKCTGHGDMGAPFWTSFVFGWQNNKFGIRKREVSPL